jgi:FlaA1/EpsC-like NDP-sugar epimerase
MASNVLGFLSEKNILVTGSTGFLGKGIKVFRQYCSSYMIYIGFDDNEANSCSLGAVFIEKILRSQPGISRIFVLVRANDAESAKIRFKTEVRNLSIEYLNCDFAS